jgi:hydroxymethylpyrimidine/phosphomethylpyrimidine kinase
MTSQRPFALSIAGFDPSAGAGILADIKTFEANGVYGFGVVSALTWQNDREFDRVEWVDVDKIISQVEVMLRNFKVKYVKIGLIENFDVLKKLVQYLSCAIENPVIILDPILKASAGFEFNNGGKEAFREAIEGIYCITPNLPEAMELFGKEDLNTHLENLSERVNIYLKGGHNDEKTVLDLLYTCDHTYAFTNDRLPYGEKHGSGCVLSAALTARLAFGEDLPVAAENANLYTYNFLASTETLLGNHQSFRI